MADTWTDEHGEKHHYGNPRGEEAPRISTPYVCPECTKLDKNWYAPCPHAALAAATLHDNGPCMTEEERAAHLKGLGEALNATADAPRTLSAERLAEIREHYLKSSTTHLPWSTWAEDFAYLLAAATPSTPRLREAEWWVGKIGTECNGCAMADGEHDLAAKRMTALAAATPASTPSLGTLPRCPKCKSADIIRIDHNRAECMACHHVDLMFHFPKTAAQRDGQGQEEK